MLPWLIGAAVVAGVGYMASSSDSSDDDDDDYERAERRRERARRREREREEERNRKNLKSEIDDFKNLSKRQIKDKYGIGISFTDAKVNLPDNGNSKIAHFKEFSKELEKDNLEIQTLISDLQKDRNAI